MASEDLLNPGGGHSRSRAIWNNITVGTDSTGLALGKGKPMFRSGMATAEVTKGNRYNTLIDWNVNLGLLSFNLKAGFDFNAGVAGPSVAFKWDTDITLNADGTGIVNMKNDVYNTGFYAGAFVNFAINFKLWFWAPWDCQWHILVDKAETLRIDLIDLLIKIFGFVYKKMSGPPKNSPARPAFENGVNNKVTIGTALQGAWNMFESGQYTYALATLPGAAPAHPDGRKCGLFDFCPAYTLGGSWSPWDAYGPAMAYVINAIANKVGVNLKFDAGVELAFPGWVYAWGWTINNNLDYWVKSVSSYQNSDLRTSLKQTISHGSYGATTTAPVTVPGSISDVKAKINMSTDCQPRLFAGLTLRAGFLGAWQPRWQISLWDILGIGSPALWIREERVSQARSFDPSLVSEGEGTETRNPYDLPPIDVVFHPVAEAVA